MPRTVTSGELALLAGDVYQVHVRISVEGPDADMRNYQSQGGFDWQASFEIDHDIDQPVVQATVELAREKGSLSLSPFRTDSTLNRDMSSVFAAAVDVGRRMTIETACTVPGGTPLTADWKLMFSGVIDTLNASTSLIKMMARDDGGVLADSWFTRGYRFDYSAAPKAIEGVIQDVLDSIFLELDPAIVVHTPVSPSFYSTQFGFDVEDAMSALQRLVQVIGWDLRYRFIDGSGFVLVLMDPQRAKTTADIVFSVKQIIKVTDLTIDRTFVRNDWTVLWGGDAVPETISVRDFASVDRFGLRRAFIREASDSPIDSLEEASAMAGYALADTNDPKATHTVDMFYTWPIELHDLAQFTANAMHYNVDQKYAVVAYKHSWNAKGTARTSLTTRGNPIGAYIGWHARARLGQDPNEPTRRNIASVTPTGDSADGTLRTLSVVCGSEVDQLQIMYRWAAIDATGDPSDFSDDSDFVDTTDPRWPRPGEPIIAILTVPSDSHTIEIGVLLPPRDFRLYVRLVPYAGFREGDSWVHVYDFADSAQSSIVAGPSSANNGVTATVSATFDTDTATGVNCARYSLDAGGSWTTITVPDSRAITFNVTRTSVKQTAIVQGLNATDENWGDQGSCDIDAYIADGPSVRAEYRAIDSVSGQIVWSCPAGIITVEIDGGLPSTPSASPIAISLDGSTHVYLFKAVQAGQTVAVNVLVPALPGPTMYAVYLELTSTTGQIVWACAAGTVTVEIDGAGPTTPSTSPIAITLDANTHAYLFKATQSGQTVAVNVPIPALAPTAPDAGGLFADTAIVEVDSGHVRVEWSYFGDPATQFQVLISYDGAGFSVFETTSAGATSSSSYPTADVLLGSGSAFLIRAYLVPKFTEGATTYTGGPSAVFGASFFR